MDNEQKLTVDEIVINTIRPIMIDINHEEKKEKKEKLFITLFKTFIDIHDEIKKVRNTVK